MKEHTFTQGGKRYVYAAGLSTDTKPLTGVITGSRFVEVDTGLMYEFDEIGSEWHEVTTEAIADAVDAWLDDHPEATTTVEDGSITEAKLASALAAKVNHPITISLIENDLYNVQV